MDSALVGLATAIGLGFLIGIDRERRKDESSNRGAAGVRTFTIAALLGATDMLVAGVIGLAIALVATAALTLGAYLRQPQEDPGITTELALVLTCALGG